MNFRGKIKKPDTFARRANTDVRTKAGTLAVRTLVALSNPRPDGKPHRDTTTFKRRAK